MRPAQTAGRRTTIATIALLALLTGACSDGGGGGDGGSAGAVDEDGLSTAQAGAEAAMEEPTTIPLTTPLDEAPEPGRTFVWMQCDTPGCEVIGAGVEAATEAIGWDYQEISYSSADPATLASGMRQALTADPVAVGLSGIPAEAGWSSVLPDFAAAGVPVVTSLVSERYDDPSVVANVADGALYESLGQILADWFIADSGGTGTVVSQRIDDFPILKNVSDAFAARVEELCPGCTVIDLNSTIPDITSGDVVSSVVSTVRSNPDATYLMSCDTEFFDGLPSALASAGLEGKVKFFGQNATVAGLTNLRAGDFAALTPGALSYIGWNLVDAAARNSEGMEFPDGYGATPVQLVTPDSDFDIGPSYEKPTDYPEQFAALWQVD